MNSMHVGDIESSSVGLWSISFVLYDNTYYVTDL